LGLDQSTVAMVRDLWDEQDLGKFTKSFTAHNIPPRGTVLVKITPQ